MQPGRTLTPTRSAGGRRRSSSMRHQPQPFATPIDQEAGRAAPRPSAGCTSARHPALPTSPSTALIVRSLSRAFPTFEQCRLVGNFPPPLQPLTCSVLNSPSTELRRVSAVETRLEAFQRAASVRSLTRKSAPNQAFSNGCPARGEFSIGWKWRWIRNNNHTSGRPREQTRQSGQIRRTQAVLGVIGEGPGALARQVPVRIMRKRDRRARALADSHILVQIIRRAIARRRAPHGPMPH